MQHAEHNKLFGKKLPRGASDASRLSVTPRKNLRNTFAAVVNPTMSRPLPRIGPYAVF